MLDRTSAPDASPPSSSEPPAGIDVALRALASGLSVWSVVDEPQYRLTCRCLGEPVPVVGWREFVAAGVAAGQLVPAGGGYRLEPGSVPTSGLESAGGVEAMRARLVESWLADRDPATAPEIALWAAAIARWDVVEETWMTYNGHTGTVPPEVMKTYRDLPLEARKDRPFLTWAAAAAGSTLAASPQQKMEVTIRQLLLDAAMLHTDWSTRSDTDAAVIAGSLRMLGERRLPSSRPGQSLEAAWRTKEEIEDFIDTRSREGNGPGRRAQAIFRTFSARLALARADAAAVLNEARWASILSDWEPIGIAARGLEALALSALRELPHEHNAGVLDRVDDELGVHGLRGMGECYEILADAYHAVRALDRAEVERTLGLVSGDDAAIIGVWSIRAAARAFQEALWGDANDGLAHLFADIARASSLGQEQEEPFGGHLLARAQLLLMTRAGAFGAAAQFADTLPDTLAFVPRARLALWSGDLRRAAQLGDSGAYNDRLALAERAKLALVRAAAVLLEGTCDAEGRTAAVRAVVDVLESENLLPVALLPKPARDALIELCEPQLGGDPRFTLMVSRLDGLNDGVGHVLRAIRLTDREKLLLPLLATDAPVPDIARRLHVSVNTVRKQVVTLREKFDADSRAELVRRARTFGALS